jgi:hypothetical protein
MTYVQIDVSLHSTNHTVLKSKYVLVLLVKHYAMKTYGGVEV